MIPIRNTYYMLAYAFQVLRQQGYRDIATEDFPSTAELLAEILIRGVRSQLKRGLGRSYLLCAEKSRLRSPSRRAQFCAGSWCAVTTSFRSTRR